MESGDSEDGTFLGTPPLEPMDEGASAAKGAKKDENVDKELQEAINILKDDDSGRRTFRGNVRLQTAFESIDNLSSDHGVTEKMMVDILDLAASGKYADNVCSKLIKSLIPRQAVPASLVVSAISWMGTTGPSMPVKSVLIRWMVLIFDRIDDLSKIQALYGPLFFFVQSETLCPYICHLLYLLTRKEDVLLCRIRILLGLQQKMGPQSHVMGLLSIYKLYCPSIVNIVVPKGRKSFFRSVDRKWALLIQQVMEQHEAQTSIHDYTQVDADSLLSQSKRRRLDIIPDAQSSLKNMAKVKSKSLNKNEPVPIQHIITFEQLVQCVDRIEWPSQSGSVLKNHHLQHVVTCHPDQIFNTRFQYWLGNTLQEEVLLQPYSSRGERLLKALGQFGDLLQEGVPVVETFLIKYLNSLNSTRLKPSVYNLLKRMRFDKYPVMHDLILEPLRNLFFSSAVYVKCQILVCITDLFENYLTTEMLRYEHAVAHQAILETKSVDLPDFYSVFQEEVDDFKPHEVLYDMMSFALDMCGSAMQVENSHVLLTHCVFNLLDVVASTFPKYGVPFVHLPPEPCVYHSLMANNGVAVARICGNLVICVTSFQEMRKLHSQCEEPETNLIVESLAKIKTFNHYIRNIMDALWLCAAFTADGDHTIFQLDSEILQKLRIPHIENCFSLYRSPALIGFVRDFIMLTQPADSLLVPDDLSRVIPGCSVDQREILLAYLKDASMDSIHNFLYKFSKKLSKIA